MARATTGMLPSTPLGQLAAESGLAPAIHLLNYRQSRYAQRLYQNPQNSAGRKEIIERKSQLADTLRKAS
jgi:flagellar hook-associated protein FlgK